ncbi:YicC/YloC family endoribonuclease [Rhodobium gokarnense]|uniref:Uncharacterized protein (TIGR00255 family) n=1 Tax=Rhodobium gokarnense TaxID=364296 RepID=A0ABT3HFJ0_9HYPH|nr:YicC/YloC family endoribonuclease [Rhodobium gokarnense]MCW2309161.1 uncharacterized protein (TIGR00255 family) [Rhodobium gokarnense]
MALASMTGFSRVDGTHADARWTWELRSVNGKGLDVRLRVPHGRESVDPVVRALAREHLTRGNLNATLSITHDLPRTTIQLNEEVLDDVLAIAAKVAERIDATAPSVDGLLALRGVLEFTENEETDEQRAAFDAALVAGFERALTDLVAARADEGRALAEIAGRQIDEIERLTAAAEACPERSVEAIRKRIAEQIAVLTEASGDLDPQRLHQEAVFIANKADIREELDRLTAHVAAARSLLADGKVVGRKLDFLAQEFNREVNTLCSKSNSVELTAIGLDLKAVVDQLREQIQNIE